MNHLYNAALTHYKSQELEALAVLDSYFNNPVAIPDHSNILKEVVNWTEKLNSARANLKTLEDLIKTETKPDTEVVEEE